MTGVDTFRSPITVCSNRFKWIVSTRGGSCTRNCLRAGCLTRSSVAEDDSDVMDAVGEVLLVVTVTSGRADSADEKEESDRRDRLSTDECCACLSQ